MVANASHSFAMYDSVQTMATSGDYAFSVIKRPRVKTCGFFDRSQGSTNSLDRLDTALFLQKTDKPVFSVSKRLNTGVSKSRIMDIWRVLS